MSGQRPVICYIIPAEGFGGAERQALFHIANLPEYGFDVITITGPGHKVSSKLSETGHGNTVRFCEFPREYAQPFKLFSFSKHLVKSIMNWWKSLQFIKSVIENEKVDIIFACRVAGWSLAAPLSRKYKIPVIWRSGSCVNGTVRRGLFRLLARYFAPDAFVANCNAVARSMQSLVASPVYILHNGISQYFLEYRAKQKPGGKPLQEKNIMFVGLAVRPSPDKGFSFLADVLRYVNTPVKSVRFIVAGEFGWREKIEKKIVRMGLGNDITFLGHVDSIAEFYCSCDMIALTSREKSIEGFSNSLLEAMALGRPVIATSAGGTSELIENDTTGIVVDTEDPVLFGDKLMELHADPMRRTFLGVNAKKAVIEHYAPQVIMNDFVRYARLVLSDKKCKQEYIPESRKSTGYTISPGSDRISSGMKSTVLSLLILLLSVFCGKERSSVFANNASLQNSSTDSVTSKLPGNNDNYSWIPVRSEMFSKVGVLSGAGNYYTILSDSLCGHLIHAEYHPLQPVVKLGYKIPDTINTNGKVSWDWRIIKPPHGSMENVKGKNDSGCSVYLVFKKELMTYVIKYVFSETLPVGTVIYKDLLNPMQKMFIIVAGSLIDNMPGKWMHIEADSREVFKRLFKMSSCPPLAGIGILSDGDQTNSIVIAEYRNFLICGAQ